MSCEMIRIPSNYLKFFEGSIDECRCIKQKVSKLKRSKSISQSLAKICSNYVIMKNILSGLDWQDRKIASAVCQLWHAVVTNLRRESVRPCQFFIIQNVPDGQITFMTNCQVKAEPMLALCFVNSHAAKKIYKCDEFKDDVWFKDFECNKGHKYLDLIYARLIYPSKVMVGVYCHQVVFLPRRRDPAAYHFCENDVEETCSNDHVAFLGGISLPKLEGVTVHRFTCPARTRLKHEDIKKFQQRVDAIVENEIIKCVLVFVLEKCSEYAVSWHIYLKYLLERQKDIPFAMGGCLVKAAVTSNFHQASMRNVRGTELTFIIMTLPRGLGGNPCSFDAHSVVLGEEMMLAADPEIIVGTLVKFSEAVPKSDHRVIFKLSCVARTSLNVAEAFAIRHAFPATPVVGCYGNGEIGVNHPSLDEEGEPAAKMLCKNWEDWEEYIFCYSTVFVVLTWNNYKPQPQSVNLQDDISDTSDDIDETQDNAENSEIDNADAPKPSKRSKIKEKPVLRRSSRRTT